MRKSFKYPYYCIDEKVNINVQGTTGKLNLETVYKGNRANAMRRYFKVTNKRDHRQLEQLPFYALNYSNDRNGQM